MGIELVKLVAANQGKLKGNEYKVLVRMALTALDRPNAKGQSADLYWGGWEQLYMALGGEDPTHWPRARQRVPSELVRRAVQGLVGAEVIEPLRPGSARIGDRQTYRLRREGLQRRPHQTSGQESPQNVGAHAHETSGQEPPLNGDRSPDSSSGPRKTQDETEDLPKDPTAYSPAQPQGDARDRGAA